MFSSAEANKQPRSFWMSSSERLQQRLPVWSSFPLPVTRDRSSKALATLQMLLIESSFYSTNMQTDDNWETRRAQGIYQVVYLHPLSLTKLHNRPFFTVILNWSLRSISVDWLSFFLSLAFGEECPRTSISYAEGIDVCPPLKEQHFSTSISQDSFCSKAISSVISAVLAFPACCCPMMILFLKLIHRSEPGEGIKINLADLGERRM